MSEPTPLLPTTVSLESGPQQYGPYLLIEKIGAGGMAEVFRAVRNGPQGFVRQFAIKRITPRHAESNDFVEMFCNEARLTAHLSHPNLVQVYDFGEIDGSYYLAMEYLKGRTVLSVMRSLHARRRTFPVSAVAFIARQVALGLSYAHTLRGAEGETLNLVHRDVNPSNIMLLKSGSVKVLDFGIAKSSALTTLQTQAGLVKGKLSYAPPEQLKCRTHRWSVGHLRPGGHDVGDGDHAQAVRRPHRLRDGHQCDDQDGSAALVDASGDSGRLRRDRAADSGARPREASGRQTAGQQAG